MKYNREELLNQLQKLIPATADSGHYLTGADVFVFDGSSIHTYNDNLSIAVKHETGLIGAVKAKDFFKLLSKLKTTDIAIEDFGSLWNIESGKTKASINLKEDSITKYLETLPLDGKFKPVPENFFQGLRLCRINGNASFLRGIYVNGSEMVATDEIRLNFYDLNSKMETFWLDDAPVNELLKLKEKMTEYHIGQGWVLFRGESGTVFSCRKNQDDGFPYDKLTEYKEQYLKTETDIIQTFPAGFSGMVGRVGTLHEDVDGFEVIAVKMNQKGFTLSSKTDSGTVKESEKWEKPFDTEMSISFRADYQFLSEVVEKCPDFYIRQGAGFVDVIFSGNGFMQIMKTVAE